MTSMFAISVMSTECAEMAVMSTIFFLTVVSGISVVSVMSVTVQKPSEGCGKIYRQVHSLVSAVYLKLVYMRN
jgi:hypothetical protein